MKNILLVVLLSTLALAEVGEVTTIKGEASVDRFTKSIKVTNNMELLKKDIVETQDGRLQMHFNDNTVISLGRESRFVIKEYIYNDGTETAAATFKIEKGFVKTITGAIGKMIPQMFALETSATTIHPHGTIWSVDVSKNTERFEVQEGKIVIAFKDSTEKSIELHSGEALELKLDDKNNKKVLKRTVQSMKTNTKYENKTSVEQSIDETTANNIEEIGINAGTTVNDDGILEIEPGVVDDGNNGHGNNPEGLDPSNPGKKP